MLITNITINKIASLATATMDGVQAVLSTFANTPGGLVLKTAAASIAGGIAATNIAKISQMQFESAGSSASSVASSVSSGVISASGGFGAPDTDGDQATTDIDELLNQQQEQTPQMQPVLVVDTFNAVAEEQVKVQDLGTL